MCEITTLINSPAVEASHLLVKPLPKQNLNIEPGCKPNKQYVIKTRFLLQQNGTDRHTIKTER